MRVPHDACPTRRSTASSASATTANCGATAAKSAGATVSAGGRGGRASAAWGREATAGGGGWGGTESAAAVFREGALLLRHLQGNGQHEARRASASSPLRAASTWAASGLPRRPRPSLQRVCQCDPGYQPPLCIDCRAAPCPAPGRVVSAALPVSLTSLGGRTTPAGAAGAGAGSRPPQKGLLKLRAPRRPLLNPRRAHAPAPPSPCTVPEVRQGSLRPRTAAQRASERCCQPVPGGRKCKERDSEELLDCSPWCSAARRSRRRRARGRHAR